MKLIFSIVIIVFSLACQQTENQSTVSTQASISDAKLSPKTTNKTVENIALIESASDQKSSDNATVGMQEHVDADKNESVEMKGDKPDQAKEASLISEVKPKLSDDRKKVSKAHAMKRTEVKVPQAQAKVSEVKPVKTTPASNAELHLLFDQLLKKYVSKSGNVNYSGLRMDKDRLKTYLKALSAVDVSNLVSRNAKMAYWINLYNAATIDLILDNYPVKKITDLDGGKTWDVKRIQTKRGVLSLNDIENGILRPTFKDARIHFAVNCAAKSCPPLANQAYTEQNLESMLQSRTSSFINDKLFNQLGSQAIALSKIFQWYKEDFKPSLVEFVGKYAYATIESNATVSFREYNWTLNGN